MDKVKLRRQLHFYGSLASIVTLLSYMLDKFEISSKILGVNILPSNVLVVTFWTGIILFVVFNFVAWGISRFVKEEKFEVIEATFTLMCQDETGCQVEYLRERIFRPRRSFHTISEGLHYSDGEIISPKAELWIASKKGDRFKKSKKLKLEAIYDDLKDPHRRSKICQFYSEGALERKNHYLHILRYMLTNSFTEEQEYFKVSIVLKTGRVRFKLVPDTNRPIVEDSVTVIKLKSKGFLNPKISEDNGVKFEDNCLVWEKKNPDVGDEYQITWLWKRP